jgi:hypothetical protein
MKQKKEKKESLIDGNDLISINNNCMNKEYRKNISKDTKDLTKTIDKGLQDL